MYTRCPACQAVYELQARLLAEAAGVLRCGNCGKTFNSLSELFEDHPAESAQPLRGQGMPPMLEQPAMIQTELLVDSLIELEPEPDHDELPELPFDPVDSGRSQGFWKLF